MSTRTAPNRHPRASGPTTPYPREACLHQLFDAQALRAPEAVAALHRGNALSYAELRARSDVLAARLRGTGVRRGEPVGVCGGRSLDALVAFLGILKAGAAYVPLDDALPPARLQAMCDDAGVRTAVVLPGSPCRLRRLRTRVDFGPAAGPEHHAEADPPAATDCAYVMFTSGSTGRPKPVAIPHRGVVRLAHADVGGSRPAHRDRVLHGYGLSSDASSIEIWSALLNGACLVLVDRDELLSPVALGARIRADRITVAYLTTSVFHHVARTAPEALRDLRFGSAGGEAMDPHLARAVLDACPRTTVVNFYGPTENTVVSTGHVVRPLAEDAATVPIGRPIQNSSCHVFRPDGTPADVGEEGELFVGGDGLALGYLGDRGLTEERFVANPGCPGARLYRTGDRAMWRGDGTLQYCGRADRQVKVRGHRVELDEVEARLRAHPAVGEAVVELDRGSLVGFVTPADGGAGVPVEEVRAELARWLPSAVVPSRIVALAEFPVTPAGKVDRARLRAADDGPVPTQRGVSGVRDSLAEVWYSTLRVRPAGTDDFFAIGGDSLTAAEVVNRTLAVLGVDARYGTPLIRGLLDNPTFDGYVEAVREVRGGSVGGADTAPPDFAAESRLGFSLPPARRDRPPRWDRPGHVVLTGATGFVGAFLLDRLLRTTEAVVHCPVRAQDAGHARRRIAAALDRYRLSPPDVAERVACLPADLTAPRLGLDERTADRIAAEADLVLHSGAQVNFVYPYRALRAANVDGTRSVVRLAAPRRVPVHFLSTIAVVAGFGTAGVRRVAEDTPLDHADRLTLGYAESKWVAEKVLQEAAEEGLPVAIHRPYEITGDQRSGVCNTETAICSLFKTVADTGLAPDIPLPMDFVPVDYVAEAVLRVATGRPATRRVYHLTNPRPARFADVLRRMRAAGCEIETAPYDEWVGELVRYVARNPTAATAPFVSLCVDRGRRSDISVKEMYFEGTFPELGRDNVDRDLADLPCPPVDDALLDRYLEHFFDSGYIERPRRAADAAG
ncbi:amino acid adenylation domain-containing protein [Saccharopolyspora rosea]|uniref:Amino acid adenylation domain-containing protein n=1 Tax=Saccharopolyspora rosea TaxID=524884 RepID=A0ABW3G0B1_9PSEU|nr:amino acid adenylation domain-containing protein [Saccharopolyspora rosea]